MQSQRTLGSKPPPKSPRCPFTVMHDLACESYCSLNHDGECVITGIYSELKQIRIGLDKIVEAMAEDKNSNRLGCQAEHFGDNR